MGIPITTIQKNLHAIRICDAREEPRSNEENILALDRTPGAAIPIVLLLEYSVESLTATFHPSWNLVENYKVYAGNESFEKNITFRWKFTITNLSWIFSTPGLFRVIPVHPEQEEVNEWRLGLDENIPLHQQIEPVELIGKGLINGKEFETLHSKVILR
jgi:hypothetical protein